MLKRVVSSWHGMTFDTHRLSRRQLELHPLQEDHLGHHGEEVCDEMVVGHVPGVQFQPLDVVPGAEQLQLRGCYCCTFRQQNSQ